MNKVSNRARDAVTLLTKTAAKEFAQTELSILVNSIHPGAVDTSMKDAILERLVECGMAPSVSAYLENARISPMNRFGKAEEIAGGVVFLCSPAASYVTGSELVIDGGETA